MYNLLRTASLELYGTDNNDVVKVAGLMRRLKNMFRSLSDKDYSEAVSTLRDDSASMRSTADQLNRNIDRLLSSIKDGDVDSYDESLEAVRMLSAQLTQDLKELNKEVPPEEEKAQKLREKYDLPAWKEQQKEILEDTKTYLTQKHPDVSLPIEQTCVVGQKFSENPHLSLLSNNIVFSVKARGNLVEKVARFVERAGTVILKDQVWGAFRNDTALLQELESRVIRSIINGSIVSCGPAKPDTKLNVKERQVGELHIQIKTATFNIPKWEIPVSTSVILTDLSLRATNPKEQLSVGYFHELVSAGPIPELLRTLLPPEKKPPEPTPTESPDYDEVNDALASGDRTQRLRKVALLLNKEGGIDHNASKRLSDSFWQKFVQMSGRLGAKAEDLAKVIYSESAFDPAAMNIQGGRVIAQGLNQLILRTAQALGMSKDQWENLHSMSAEQQLDWVEKYFRLVGGSNRSWASATQLYVANFAPKYINQSADPAAVLYQDGTKEYSMNKGLDRDKKGFITAGDLSRSVQGPLPKHIVASIEKAKSSVTGEGSPNNPAQPESSDMEADKVMNMLLAASPKPLTKLVKNAILKEVLPTSTVLVTISSLSASASVRRQFAKSLSYVLANVIDAETNIHMNGDKLEVQCVASGMLVSVASAVQALCDCVIDAVDLKMGEKVKVKVLPGEISSYDRQS